MKQLIQKKEYIRNNPFVICKNYEECEKCEYCNKKFKKS